MVGYGGKDLQKRKVLSLEWKSKEVMDDESGESIELMEEVPLEELGEAELGRLVRGWRRGAGNWFTYPSIANLPVTYCKRPDCRSHRLRMPTNCHAYVHLYAYIDCETIFHPDYGGRVGWSRVKRPTRHNIGHFGGGRDLPSTPSDNLWKLIYLATEALNDSFEFIGAIEISLSIYLSICNDQQIRKFICYCSNSLQREWSLCK